MYIWDETRTVNNLKKDIENRFPETEIKKNTRKGKKIFYNEEFDPGSG